MSLFRYSDHVRSFGAFFGHFWPLLANFGPKLKIVVNWSYDHSKQSQDEQKSNGDGLGCHFSDIQAILGSLGPFSAIFGHFWQLLATFCPKLKIVVNWPCDHSKRSQEKQKSDGYGFRWHFYVSNILIFGPNFAKNGPKGPKKT